MTTVSHRIGFLVDAYELATTAAILKISNFKIYLAKGIDVFLFASTWCIYKEFIYLYKLIYSFILTKCSCLRTCMSGRVYLSYFIVRLKLIEVMHVIHSQKHHACLHDKYFFFGFPFYDTNKSCIRDRARLQKSRLSLQALLTINNNGH